MAHEEVNVAMAMGLQYHVAVLLCSNLASSILQCGDAVLLHERNMFRMQSVVVVLLKQGEDAVCEWKGARRTRRGCRHWS